ncbi:MAG: hypothetical protein GXY44_06260 [Phycisphaerales bacterium]|nr:hypothetical protein [Phycisphaerales bacterium]
MTRAPGRLDCLGGMADFSGALALQMPIDRCAHVAVSPRQDQRIFLQTIGYQENGPCMIDWPLSLFYNPDGTCVPAQEFAAHFATCPWAVHVAGVFWALLASQTIPHFAGGVTLLLHSDIPSETGLAASAAIQVATAKALAGLFDAPLEATQLAGICRIANVDVVGAEPGLVDHLTCLLGEPNTLLQIRCQPNNVLGVLPLPQEVGFAAICTGVRLPIYRQRYADNRATSLIGRFLIEQILRGSGQSGNPTGEYLANISPSEYTRRFRNELPVKLRGRDFLGHFGQPSGFEVQVDPAKIYKVRSRTEHHIYENDRTHRFVERLARARRTGERDALTEAGELMYSSHWSYGQRCGTGSIETDILVNLIREQGPARGLYGAKVTGGGCGGTVAVLMADNETAHAALPEVCEAYTQKTGHTPIILTGSMPGADHFGCRGLD